MPLVVDASALYAFLVDGGAEGRWARTILAADTFVAPSLLPYEVANALRKHAEQRKLTSEHAARAHTDLLALRIPTVPYELLAGRIWELRGNLTIMDASYIALAEVLGVPLVTLDGRSGRAPGVRCPTIEFPQLQP